MVQFTVLGTLEISDDGRAVLCTAPKLRQVLSLLLVRANQLVQVESVIRELWGDAPPKSASATVQTYIYQLRKRLRAELGAAEGQMLCTQPFGYQLRLAPERLDVCLFEQYADEGRRLLEEDRAADAALRLRQALALWRGPFLADVTRGPLLNAHAVHLQEQRMRTLEMRIQADMRLGRNRELIGELRSLVALYPLDEWFHAQLIEVLQRSGRRGEALESYHHLRRLLRAELGLDPSPELQILLQRILSPLPSGILSSHRPAALQLVNGRPRP
ncbi:BTAD domain-containing putative transcriptional regulator [Streptomyces coeruleorubidus]|uniref:AfsR/SARP family transcriptional regulator n=1 Tax=Streptomyces coeruleorubidus TaxID=116188 RepID=UPI0037AF35EA